MTLIDRVVGHHRIVHVQPDYFRGTAPQHAHVATKGDGVFHKGTATGTEIDDNVVRSEECLNPDIKINRAVDTAKTSSGIFRV